MSLTKVALPTVRSKCGKLVFQPVKKSVQHGSKVSTWFDVIVTKGKRRPSIMTFHTEKAVAEYITNSVKLIETKKQARAEAAVARKEKAAQVKVGDIFVSSWGYEQTNVDFYRVVKLVGTATVVLQKLTNQVVEGSMYPHGMACNVVPGNGTVDGQFKVRINQYGSVKISSYRSASKWDGKPRYNSWYY